MGKVSAKPNVSNTRDWQELQRYTSQCLQDIVGQVNGNLTFSDNLSISVVDHTFTTNSVVEAVRHNLGRAPLGYVVIGTDDDSAIVYMNNLNQRDAEVIYLGIGSGAPAMVKLLFF